MVIGLSSDHGGVNLKERIKMHLEAQGIKVSVGSQPCYTDAACHEDRIE